MVLHPQRVLVIGNENSANEMTAQLAPIARTPVYRSIRRVSIFPPLPDARIQDIGAITRYSTSDKNKITVHLHDGSSIEYIDIVLFGTGYYPHVPYFQTLHPESCPNIMRHNAFHLQILYAHNPTLAFIGSTISFMSFFLAEFM
ncbi:hypothetical protein K503DRAFT_771250, partial [Rhizopogon vinicolor AM-OR11-026]